MPIDVTPLTGEAMRPHLEALAALRIAVFREWPYLYDGDMDEEWDYLESFAVAPNALLVLARDAEQIVGASTALPLVHAHTEFSQPFRQRGENLERIFYFGESVLLPACRGKGVGHLFFDEREGHVARLGGYGTMTFCSVVRPDDHPLRPADARSHDVFWTKRGYVKRPELTCSFTWKDVDRDDQTDKTLVFWTKRPG